MGYGFKDCSGGGGASGATLIVTAPVGVTVAISKDDKTKTKVSGDDGIAVFKGVETGTWNVTITDGTQSFSRFVDITPYSITIEFFDGYLYNAGDECEYVTDGWYCDSTDINVRLIRESTYMSIYSGGIGTEYHALTTSPFDTTGYSKITFSARISAVGDKARVGILDADKNIVAYKNITSTTTSSLVLYISSYQGIYFPFFSVKSTVNDFAAFPATVYVYSIKIE